MKTYDAIIIGTGQAGVPLAKKLNQEGWKTAVIEKSFPGGTCVNTGCTPTKVYKASATVASDARKSEAFGVTTGNVSVDLKRIWKRKESFLDESRQNIRKALEEAENVTFIKGHARFVDNYTIEVNGKQLRAERIFVNVGARARRPAAFSGQVFMTNEEMLQLQEIPAHLIIIGGSYIGLEFGQMFRRFGAQVTIVEKSDRIIPREDKAISSAIQSVLEKEGINFQLEATCTGGSRQRDQLIVDLSCKSPEKTVSGTHVLVAVGRQPNTDDLGLENTDLETDEHGYLKVDHWLRTKVEGIYALGDCNGEGAFTHTAYNDYQIVSDKLFGQGVRSLHQRIMAYALYIEPALGRVGKTETQAREVADEVAVYTIEMSKVARARQKGKAEGLLRIIVNKSTAKIMGAAFFGLHGDELINGIADVMYAEAPYTTIRDAMHVHPTVAEMIPTMLED